MVNLNYITLPESFFQEETRQDFLITRQRKEVWAIELDLLQLVKNICDKYNISWFIHGGTLLGAVRDGKFIPWDDDIDIIMTRDNYEKFISICEEEMSYPYFPQNYKTDPNCINKFCKIRRLDTMMCNDTRHITPTSNSGIFLDIFPMDKLPDDIVERFQFISKLVELRRSNENLKYFEKFTTKYNNLDGSDYMESGLITNRSRYKDMVYKVRCFESTQYTNFEGIEVPIPGDYETFLEDKYGTDWRVPKLQASNHKNQIYDTDNSYKSYSGIVNSKTFYIGQELLEKIRDVNSLIYTGKPYKRSYYTQILIPEFKTINDITEWLSTEIPNNFKRIITLDYIKDGYYRYSIKLYSGEIVEQSDESNDTDNLFYRALKSALDSIINS